ncbi:MAG TPA: hypothetical protein VFH27_09610 [Longimicrobiaceae bacterium]|nr:hypothetical protein [Longimicrobiaceae bacterium]
MKITRVYLDTSTIGGCFDDEFALWSQALMEDFSGGVFLPVVSDLLAAEIRSAPSAVQELYLAIRKGAHEFVETTLEVEELQSAYASRGILGARWHANMMHVALASVAGADVLASWNFKHIVRFDKIRQFNAVNLELGYRQIAIHSPREVSSYERDEDQRR